MRFGGYYADNGQLGENGTAYSVPGIWELVIGIFAGDS